MSSNLHVRSVLKSIDNVSKLFLLSQSTSQKSASPPTWKSVTFWNVWTLAGCFSHISFHLIYTSQNDIFSERPKLVTLFIDTYNKYCGLALSATLVLVGYFQQKNIAEINEIFKDVENIFLKQLQIKIKNFNNLRYIFIQITLLLGVLMYTEYNNCLMYLSPTSANWDKLCLIVCIIPMLTTAIVECRLFAYFLLMKERLRIINKTIDFYRKNLIEDSSNERSEIDDQRVREIESKIFLISELVGPKKVKARKPKSFKMNLKYFKSIISKFFGFLKNLLNIRKNKISDENFDALYKNETMNNNYNSRNCVERVCSMQIIYSKLHEITDLISRAYGVQIISIISVQFITLTTLLYYSTMKAIRFLSSDQQSNEERSAALEEITSGAMWIAIFLYKLYSICYSVHTTNSEAMKVGHYIHVFGLQSKHLDDKFKIKMILLNLLQQRFKLTPFGLFDIDLGLFSMITGAVVTYILILIQFDISQQN